MTETLYTSIIHFRVHPGREKDFVTAFHACGMLKRPRDIAGFVSGKLLQQNDDPASFSVVAHWRTPKAYAEWGRMARVGVEETALEAFLGCIADVTVGKLYAPPAQPR
jgi:heme-degrading monooxygenase HmoA